MATKTTTPAAKNSTPKATRAPKTPQEPLKIGLFVGREWSWPPAFIEEVNRRDEGVTAEYVKVGGTSMNEPCPYRVIVDRISHEVPYYRSYLKNAALQGTRSEER